MPKSEIAESTVVLFPFLWEISNTVFHRSCINLDSDRHSRRVLLYPHSGWHLLFVCFLMITILTSVGWYLIVILICVSLMINDAEHLFICLLAICMPPLEKHLFRSSAEFFNLVIWVLFFFLDVEFLWAFSTPAYIYQENKNANWKRCMHFSVHRSFIYYC